MTNRSNRFKLVDLLLSAITMLAVSACSSSGKAPGGPPDLGPAGTDASLSSLSLTDATLDPMFSPSVTSYTVTVPQSVNNITVSATTNDIFASSDTRRPAGPLALGDSTIDVVVTAEDGVTTRTYTILVTRLNFAQEAYIKASNSGADDTFGGSVALSSDGNTMAVGAQNEDSSASGVDGDETNDGSTNSGAVYVFARGTGGAWTQQAYLKASNTDADPAFAEDFFGLAVAISADGNTLAVGATREDSIASGVNGDETDNSAQFAGAVYVFTRDNDGVWTQQAYVKASTADVVDLFGRSVAVSADGDTMAVGAFLESSAATGINGNQFDNTALDAGAAYVFTRSSGVWTQQAYIKPSNTDADDRFGFRVALSADGATLAVSAQNEDSAATGVNGDDLDDSAVDAGAAYVFTRDTGGVWTQQAYIKAANAEAADHFGTSADLSSDGNTLLVGAFWEDSGDAGNELDNSVVDSGAAYVFTRDSGGTWLQQAYIKASSLDENDHMGWDAALAGDASKLAISVHHEDSVATGVDGDQSDNNADGAGAALVFSQDSGGAWVQQAYIKASNTDLIDNFGVSVALSEDGNLLAVGAHREDSADIGIDGDQADNSAESAGALYVFQ
jgi:hypothetical protein